MNNNEENRPKTEGITITHNPRTSRGEERTLSLTPEWAKSTYLSNYTPQTNLGRLKNIIPQSTSEDSISDMFDKSLSDENLSDKDYFYLSENHLFRQILEFDDKARKKAIDKVVNVIRFHCNTIMNSKDENEIGKSIQFLEGYKSVIARFAYQCPFDDISNAFQSLIMDLFKMVSIFLLEQLIFRICLKKFSPPKIMISIILHQNFSKLKI